jgi:hypothetical protein
MSTLFVLFVKLCAMCTNCEMFHKLRHAAKNDTRGTVDKKRLTVSLYLYILNYTPICVKCQVLFNFI